jgi:hypothetical protein
VTPSHVGGKGVHALSKHSPKVHPAAPGGAGAVSTSKPYHARFLALSSSAHLLQLLKRYVQHAILCRTMERL